MGKRKQKVEETHDVDSMFSDLSVNIGETASAIDRSNEEKV